MKKLTLFFFLFPLIVKAQKGDELLVYSLKGNATVVENNKESKLKIGKVLKPGCTLKTQRDAKLTMVCKEGKPISVTREGSFPVGLWKDSCFSSNASVTSKYFQYIWDQLYVRSDDYKRDHPEGSAALTDAPVRGQDEIEIVFNPMLDTVYYGGGNFPLSWNTSFQYAGRYYFVLFADKGGKAVYKDSISGNTLPLEKLKKYMKQGSSYHWTIATQKTGEYKGGMIKYVTTKTVSRYIIRLQRTATVAEDQAAQYFRIAYQLLNSHYPANAYLYYQKAATIDPANEFYKEKLEEFRTNFNIR